MFKITRWFIWGIFTLLLLTAVDQVLLRVDLPVPGYVQIHKFYVDFRTRLIGLTGEETDSVGQLIKAKKIEVPTASLKTLKKALPAQLVKKAKRYLYVDTEGALQFADTLEQVPLQFRRDAQPLSE